MTPPTCAERALAMIVRHGVAMREFVDRMRERGEVAVTELEDLAMLRVRYVVARAVVRRERGR